jgi:hypothetical protein
MVEHILNLFEKRVLREKLGPKRQEVTGDRLSYIMMSITTCTPR